MRLLSNRWKGLKTEWTLTPMKRRFFTILAALSLLLCVAMVGLWVHSRFRAVSFGYAGSPDAYGTTRMWEVGSKQGRITWMVVWHWANSMPAHAGFFTRSDASQPRLWLSVPASTPNGYGAAGFYFERMQAPVVAWDRRYVAVPYWFLIATLLVLPTMRWLKGRRPVPGCCPTCGYDLRATTDRCPECGTPIPS